MEAKFLNLILLTTILLSAIASASVGFTVDPAVVVFTQTTDIAKITLTNTGNETANFVIPSVISITDGDKEVLVTLDKYTFTLAAGQNEAISASVNPDSIDALDYGIYSVNLDIKATSNASDENVTKSITFRTKKSYCENGPVNNSVFEIRSIDESGSSSDDDWKWYPQDEITLTVKVKNNDDDNDRTARIEWDIYDKDTKEFLDIGEDDTVDIDSNDYSEIEFTFEVPYDLERGTRYVLYIKAYDDDDGEEEICTVVGDNEKSASLDAVEGIPLQIERDKTDVVVTKTDLPELLTCGSTIDAGLWIANVGRAREDKIKVTLLGSVFGSEVSREISKLDWDDKAEKVTFPVTVPSDLQEGNYKLKFKIEYDYDDNDDQFGELKTVEYPIEIKGNCEIEQNLGATITAALESDAVEGEQLKIKGTIKNTGDEKTAYVLSVLDYSSWASLDKIEPRLITLDAGSSQDFLVYLNVGKDTAGEQFFKIRTDFGTGESEEQEVSVAIEKSAATSPVTGSVITDNLRENWFIWLIVVINLVLIIAIILVARRIITAK
ncbi:hypothetical protein A3K73_03305 [Candidatus Pacearchaeota archaeon RBG_13_36_9]|nr:MAG: hypothetical protein A3K73_03305 [Candidatus Pacearchaeota archaeon RBG_13_36_9]